MSVVNEVKRLIQLVVDSGGQDRKSIEAAEKGLKQITSTEAVEPLIEALRHPIKNVQSLATEALGNLGDSRAVEPLIQCLSQDGYDALYSAVKALERLGDTRAVKPLIDAARAGCGPRDTIIQALGNLGDPQAVDLLAEALNDESDLLVPTLAVDALIKIAKKDIRAAAILEAAKDHKDIMIKMKAKKALGLSW